MKTVFVVIEHGLSLAYFLYTDLYKQLLEGDIRLVFLVQDELLPKLREEFSGISNLVFESLRENEANQYHHRYYFQIQEILEYIRGSSMDYRIPLTYVDTNRKRKISEATGRWRYALYAAQPVIYILRYSRLARRVFLWLQKKLFTPKIYTDLLEKYSPDLVISDAAGWRLDRYLLREVNLRGIKTVTAIVGWDNPSSNGLVGASVEYVNVWSKIHAWEMNVGLDWPMDKIHIGGMPLYDNYLSGKWAVSRDRYFKEHGLDPDRKLIAFVATAMNITPNLHLVKLMADIISGEKLSKPSQLLVRLHPNHFRPIPHYEQEREAIYELAKNHPNVHIVAPQALAGDLPRYSGEDFQEKGSMLAHADVVVTIYSTMVVEAAIHDKPVVSACINTPTGWKDHYWIPLSDVPTWPTAARVDDLGASRVAFSSDELIAAINIYLENPALDAENRRQFLKQELTFLKAGEATRETASFFLSLLER
jgi:hypothetical protein